LDYHRPEDILSDDRRAEDHLTSNKPPKRVA
jgi:hypothetical protein